MYQAKDRGKGRWELFDEAMRSSARLRLETENALHRALERDELRVYYQPIVELGGVHLLGAEALVRWQHPDRGSSRPDEFIDLAEETGLIVPIGAWVLEEACRQLMEWRADGLVSPTFTMAVNLSARQLAQADLVEQRRGRARTHRRAAGARLPRDHRERADGRDDDRGASTRSARSACGSASTTSAPATRRSATCGGSRSTRSRSTARSWTASAPSPRTPRSSPRSSGSATRSA